MNFHLGFRYANGKIWVYRTLMEGNPKPTMTEKPAFSVDIREIIAMTIVGIGATILLIKDCYTEAMLLYTNMLTFATTRTAVSVRNHNK